MTEVRRNLGSSEISLLSPHSFVTNMLLDALAIQSGINQGRVPNETEIWEIIE